VEFVLILPVLLIIAFGVMDLGRTFFATIVIQNAAREGARYGIAHPADSAGIRAVAVQEAAGLGLQVRTGDVGIACSGGCRQGDALVVTVQHSFRPSMEFLMPGTIVLSRSAEMMVLGP
jgi:Flp pilus assembly protein TadG